MKLLLASQSPRRAALLNEAGFSFEQQAPDFDDSFLHLPPLPPLQMVTLTAWVKAQNLAERYPEHTILAADTMICHQGRTLGKPADTTAARQILMTLHHHWQQVVTGIVICNRHRRWVDVVITGLQFQWPDDFDLEDYLATRQWQGKAGGYNLGELQDRWQFQLQGDPNNVIGLPVEHLKPILQSFEPVHAVQ